MTGTAGALLNPPAIDFKKSNALDLEHSHK